MVNTQVTSAQPVFIQQTVPEVQQQQMRQSVNFLVNQQQAVIINQQSQVVSVQPGQQMMRRSNVIFQNQPQPHIVSTPYQAAKTISVYVTPQALAKIN